MDFLFSHFPEMSILEWGIHIIALIGAVLITYAIFLEAERRQDLVFFIGGACLLIYALWLNNKIFTIAMIGLTGASLFEVIEIMMGIHKHGPKGQAKYNYPKK